MKLKSMIVSDFELMEKIKKLSPDYQSETNNLIDYLLGEKNDNEIKDRSGIFGVFRGKITMLPGFDDPIEGMEEYI